MAHLYFYPNGPPGEGTSASPADVLAYAETCLAGLQPDHPDPVAAALGRLPALRDREAILAGLSLQDRATTSRYWSQQESMYAPIAEELMPPSSNGGALRFACLASRWQGFAPGTLVAVRETTPIGTLAVFDGWTVNATGRVDHISPTTSLNLRTEASTPHSLAMGMVADNTSGDAGPPDIEMFDHALTLINYVAQGLSGIFPVAGPLVSALVGIMSQGGASGAMNGGIGMLDAFAQQLKANDAALETDLASAQLMTYQQWADRNYQDAWLQDVMTGDPASKAVLNEKSTLDGFVKTVTKDLQDRKSELLTAVNLMMTETPAESTNLNNPTLAMLKSPGFFFMSNYVLTLGKQAFTAQLTMEGDQAAAEVGKAVAELSTVYSQYAANLRTAVEKQISDRLAQLHLDVDNAYCKYIIHDDYDPDPSNMPAGYERYVWTFCGNAEANSMWTQAQAKYAEVCDSYRHLFWCGDPAKREAAVTQMLHNDTNLQATAVAPS